MEETIQQEQSQQPIEQENKTSANDHNIRAMREQYEAERRKSQEQAARIKELEEYVSRTAERAEQEETAVQKQQKKIKEQENMLDELRLKARYSDFDAVVNEENIKQLAQDSPELLKSIYLNESLYDRGSAAYSLIKSAYAASKKYESESKIEDNLKKPKSSSSAGAQAANTPLSHVDQFDRIRLSKDDIRRLNEQRRQCIKNAR